MKLKSLKGALALGIVFALLMAMASAEETVDVIMNAGTTQAFSDEAVSRDDLEVIVKCGLAATSAINQQPWYFAVLTNKEIMSEISSLSTFGGAPSGVQSEQSVPPQTAPANGAAPSAKASLGSSPAAIIVYADDDTKSPDTSFDCGLACQNMVIAASALGYATKIVSSPTMSLNGDNHDELCEKLGVDKAFNAVAVLLIGYAEETTDAVTSASTRSPIEEKATFVE